MWFLYKSIVVHVHKKPLILFIDNIVVHLLRASPLKLAREAQKSDDKVLIKTSIKELVKQSIDNSCFQAKHMLAKRALFSSLVAFGELAIHFSSWVGQLNLQFSL